MYVNTNSRAWPGAGTVVSVPTHVLYRHEGIVSDRWQSGRPMVISGSARAGRVCEEFWDEFAQGQPVRIDGYPSALPPHVVVRRARERINTRYHLLDWNCQHLVAHAHGREPQSTQLAVTAVVALISLALLASRSHGR